MHGKSPLWIVIVSLLVLLSAECGRMEQEMQDAPDAGGIPSFIIVDDEVWVHPREGMMPDNMEYVGEITYISKRRSLYDVTGIACATNLPSALEGKVYRSQDGKTVAIALKDSKSVYVATNE